MKENLLSEILEFKLTLSLILFMLSLSLFLVLNRCCKQNQIQLIPAALGLITFCYLFYQIKNDSKIEINPFSIIFIIIAIPLLIIIGTFFYRQSKLVLLGINTKQFVSIGTFRSNKDNNIQSINKDYIRFVFPELKPLSFKEKLNNLRNLIFRKREKSLVFEELEKILGNKN